MSADLFALFAVLLGIAGTIAGYIFGVRRGKAAGWVDHYIETEREKRERRDSQGRFKAKGAV